MASAEYLWGQKAVKTFNLLSQGYHLGATMHARTSEEANLRSKQSTWTTFISAFAPGYNRQFTRHRRT